MIQSNQDDNMKTQQKSPYYKVLITKISNAISVLSLILVSVGALSGCDKPATEKQISFAAQVKPILAANCLSCHNQKGKGYQKSGLSMETYTDLMKGTRYGPVIIPGNAVASNLVILIDGKAPNIKMPHGSLLILPKSDRDMIKSWINQGAMNN